MCIFLQGACTLASSPDHRLLRGPERRTQASHRTSSANTIKRQRYRQPKRNDTHAQTHGSQSTLDHVLSIHRARIGKSTGFPQPQIAISI
jgi:hypothetical protein